jgi:hypothetical protein
MAEATEKPVCGIVMPISAIDGCTESHWSDVLEILTEAIEEAGFAANLVSNADDVGLIHKRIIQNLYDNPIVVCDVSGKNPNVMFELGLRLAFDKPTLIVKDEKTSYSFDTSGIEHVEYPRDLRFSRIVEFKQKLTEKIKATNEKAKADASFSTFLKHFGEFTVAKLEKKEVPGQEFIIEELKAIRTDIRRLEVASVPVRDAFRGRGRLSHPEGDFDICLKDWSTARVARLFEDLKSHPDVRLWRAWERADHQHIAVTVKPGSSPTAVEEALRGDAVTVRRVPRMRPPAAPTA